MTAPESTRGRQRIPVLAGPTGSGKTSLVCSLDPDVFDVIACDSRQIYAEMPLGTAGPRPDELARMPHKLVAIVSPADGMTAGRYVELANEALRQTIADGKIPLLVVGTGFYYMALQGGLFAAGVNPDVRARVAAMEKAQRLEELSRLDPAAIFTASADGDRSLDAVNRASVERTIHPHDDYRIGRALEITLTTGKPWSVHWREAGGALPGPYEFFGFKLEPPKESHSRGLLDRARRMVEAGFVEEALAVRRKYGDCPGLRAIGYDLALLTGDGILPIDAFITELGRRHWQYARRQMTWFRRQKELEITLPADFKDRLTASITTARS